MTLVQLIQYGAPMIALAIIAWGIWDERRELRADNERLRKELEGK